MGIYAVWGPPQSGKTTLAIDLAFVLSSRGKSVCLISPEPFCELGARLNIRIAPEKSLLAASKNPGSLRQLVYTVDDLLYVLAVPFDCDAFGDEVSVDAAKTLLQQAGELFDAVIVDCPSHTDSAIAAWALNQAERVLQMTGANSAAAMWAMSFRKVTNVLKERTVSVCAELSERFDYRHLHSLLGKAPAVWLPFLPDADILQSQRRTLYQAGSKAGKNYSKSLEQLCEIITGKESEAS